jgi:hypothetical protein
MVPFPFCFFAATTDSLPTCSDPVPCRVDVSDQVQDILGGTHAKSASARRHFFVSCRYFSSFTLKLFVYLPTVTALEKLHAKHALPGFTDRSAEEKEIEAATTDITKVCHFLSYDYLVHFPFISSYLFCVTYFPTGFSTMSEINSKNWLGTIPCISTFFSKSTA